MYAQIFKVQKYIADSSGAFFWFYVRGRGIYNDSFGDRFAGLSQSHEIIHDKLVTQKSSLENIVNKTSEIMGLQEDFGVVQKDIKLSADESLKALSQVGSSLQSLGIVRCLDSIAACPIFLKKYVFQLILGHKKFDWWWYRKLRKA